MKEVLVTGASGLVGSRFVEFYPSAFSLLTPDEKEMDITNLRVVEKYIAEKKPDVILHFAAFTDVVKAEEERGNEKGVAWRLNVIGTKNLFNASEKVGAFFVYISTDNVFPGIPEQKGPYAEDALPPINYESLTWYGWTKLQGERVLANYPRHAIVRISYPYRARYSGKSDYARKILALFDERKLYPMFTDQHFTPTFIDEACRAFARIIEIEKRGTFHVVSRDVATPCEFASYLIEKARGVSEVVKPGSLVEFAIGQPSYRYPMYGGLRCEKTQEMLKMKFRSWKEGIDEFVRQIRLS